MKVTLKIDVELVPVIIRALNEYTEKSVHNILSAAMPSEEVPVPKQAVKKVAKATPAVKRKRGRPPKQKALSTVVLAPSVEAKAA